MKESQMIRYLFLFFIFFVCSNAIAQSPIELNHIGQIKIDKDNLSIIIKAENFKSGYKIFIEAKSHKSEIKFDSGRNPLNSIAVSLRFSQLDPSSGTQAIIEWGTFGAHCCTITNIITYNENKLIKLNLKSETSYNLLFDTISSNYVLSNVNDKFRDEFDCYACSNPPSLIYKLRGSILINDTKNPFFYSVLSDRLKEMEDNANENKNWWSNPGFLAGWVAQKELLNQGPEAWSKLKNTKLDTSFYISKISKCSKNTKCEYKYVRNKFIIHLQNFITLNVKH
jgi:hypothetical protein